MKGTLEIQRGTLEMQGMGTLVIIGMNIYDIHKISGNRNNTMETNRNQ